MKAIYRAALLLALSLALLAAPASASGVTVALPTGDLAGCFLEDGTTWVPLRAFCESMGSTVGWDGATERITVQNENFTAYLTLGSRILEAEGRFFWMSDAPVCPEDITYLPVRALAGLYGLEVGWDGSRMAVTLTGGSPLQAADQVYNDDDLYWLSRIIFAESGNEPLEGQIAVGNVVLNRVAADEYPDTIYGVIFDDKYGVQFTPSVNGSIHKTPSQESVMAAKMVLEGAETVPDSALYFIGTTVSSSHWMKRTCDLLLTIGGHSFFANP